MPNSGSCSIVRSEPKITHVAQHIVVDRRGAAVEQEERLIGADEIAHLRRELDHPVRLLRLGDELRHIHGEDDAGRAAVQDRPLDRTGVLRRRRGAGRARELLGIDTFDHREAPRRRRASRGSPGAAAARRSR